MDFENENIPFNSLSPISDYKKNKEYCDALDWALGNRKKESIKNLALTGTYGSGKSSILKTYQKHHKIPNLHFLNISLATFKEEFEKKDEEGKVSQKTPREKNEQLRLVELSILQQIFYHEDNEKIPDSRFKKVRRLKEKNIHLYGSVILGLLISFYFAFKFPSLKKLFLLNNFSREAETTIVFFTILIFIVLLFLSIKEILQFSQKLTINKLNFQNIEIEVSKNINKSILNNHLDEILYFFEATDYNVVIIEDLDRFEQTEIFTKFREINLLINSSKSINRDVVFIYAVRDEMFKDSERTKFFDFIIPIIPVINYSNSSENLKNALKKFKYKISTALIDDIAFYVNDMRLLYNVVNEFHLYKTNLKADKYLDKLFALIVYKNLYPDDFVLLGKSDGVLYKYIHDNKDKWITKSIKEIELEIEELKKHLEHLKDIFPKDILELRKIYLFEILKEMPSNYRSFKFEGQIIESNELITETENFDLIINDKLKYYSSSGYDRDLPKFQEIEKKVNDDLSFQQREKLIMDNNSSKSKEIRDKIKDLEQKKIGVRNYKLQRLLNDGRLKLETNNEKQNLLIYQLLKSGYIAEDYLSFISYFYPGSLTEKDYLFLMNVKNESYNEYDFKLGQVKNLIEKIGEYDFNKSSILNYDIVDFLISKNTFPSRTNKLFKQLSNESETSINFIKAYIENGKYLSIFIKKLASYWSRLWPVLPGDISVSEENELKYLQLLIDHADIKDIKLMSENSNLTDIISKQTTLDSLYTDENKFIEVLKNLAIKFTNLEFDKESENIKNVIYNNNLYDINLSMLKLILQYNGNYDAQKFEKGNYSLLKNSSDSKVSEYIDLNIETYIYDVFLKLEENKFEEEEHLKTLIEKEILSEKLKKQIISKVETKIKNFDNSHLSIEIINSLFSHLKIEATWSNVFKYWELQEEKGFNEILNKFLNNSDNVESLAANKISEAESFKDFRRELTLNNDIENIFYKKYLISLPIIYKELFFENLSQEKVFALIEKRKIEFNEDHFNRVDEYFEDLTTYFIEKNKIQFFKIIKELILSTENVIGLLKSDEFNLNEKIKLLEDMDQNIILSNVSVLTQIGILNRGNLQMSYSQTILENVLLKSEIEDKDKIEIFNSNNQKFAYEFVNSFLNSLKGNFSKLTGKGPTPTFNKTDYLTTFFEYLKDKDLISKIIDKGNKVKVTTYKK